MTLPSCVDCTTWTPTRSSSNAIFRDHGIETRQYLHQHYPTLSGSHEFLSRLIESTVGKRLPEAVLEADEPRTLPPSPRAVIAKVLTDTASFRDQLCACEDKPCADRVSHAMTRWTREFGLR